MIETGYHNTRDGSDAYVCGVEPPLEGKTGEYPVIGRVINEKGTVESATWNQQGRFLLDECEMPIDHELDVGAEDADEEIEDHIGDRPDQTVPGLRGPFDISIEEFRTYQFNSCIYTIHNPVLLYVGNTCHRVVDSDGIAHCPPAPGYHGCVVRWKYQEGCKPVTF